MVSCLLTATTLMRPVQSGASRDHSAALFKISKYPYKVYYLSLYCEIIAQIHQHKAESEKIELNEAKLWKTERNREKGS